MISPHAVALGTFILFWISMRAPLVVLLFSYGISHGLGFVQPSSAVLSQRRRSNRCFLFSPEDDKGPIVITTAKPSTAVGRKVSREPGGGWGSWEKVVSQRVEQDSVLQKLQPPSGLQVRTIEKGDMLGVSRLCIDTFRGPFQWFELPLQLFQEFAFFGQIQGRLGRVTRNEIKHSMVIVEDTSSTSPGGSRGKVVGFLEIGMLPKPSSSEESALAGEALTAARAAAALAAAATTAPAAAAAAAAGKGGGKAADRSPLSPAAKLDPGTGTAATAAEEEDGRSDDAGGSTTAIRKEKQPDVAYLANVVVDRRQRRRGIGRTMVSSAIEIVRELWPAEESIYVSVEQGNDIALALYQGMGFESAALEDEMMARSRRRPPRIYLSKPLRE